MSARMRRIAAERRSIALLVGLVACASAVGVYVLAHQRIVFPWQDSYRVRAELVSAKGFVPGQGQSVTVSGIAVGQITDVRLSGGRAVVTMVIDRTDLPQVYRDARLLVRPKTALADMAIALDPGTEGSVPLPDDGVLPAAQTAPTVDVDEVLAALDTDARTYLRALLNAGGEGLRGRGAEVRAILKAGTPTLAKARRITAVLRARDRQLARLVHNLRAIAQTAAPADRDLADLISTSTATFGTLAAGDRALRDSVGELPATLTEARRALTGTARLAAELGPALRELRPATSGLDAALRATRPLLRAATPALRTGVRPLARDARPVARDLAPAVSSLGAATPPLARVFETLRTVTNELAHEPDGPRRSYLFWMAWFAHNGNSTLSTGDATGAVYRALSIFTCPAYRAGQPEPVAQLIDALPFCSKDGAR